MSLSVKSARYFIAVAEAESGAGVTRYACGSLAFYSGIQGDMAWTAK
ncbi:hypothetical protein F4827_005968 [Paraburkholderia bannensis]|uniref:Uncharacterized protein n=1 Tax=Paraburkholderia bannensis TaxID=765414 RepID=A0A7W9U300_9BURK|nr:MULTISPECIES: hypothetical protein [Paraburkholderia]MBB3261061.1 hypothetical protein [Paraburkholderia sp. WP4_3_2]MBB6106098.1 hypothetical protein [Paraburkholderia bannensis]